MRLITLYLAVWALVSCDRTGTISTSTEPILPVTGAWHLSLDIGEEQLPMDLELLHNGATWSAVILNADERIEVQDLQVTADSLIMRMPLFDSDFKAEFKSPTQMTGIWTNYLKSPDYKIPFIATSGETPRFPHDKATAQLTGNWEVRFSPDTDDEYPAIGSFTQVDDHLSGTFITETGDYRFLEGVVDGDSLKLSCFDGSHAFLFKAQVNGNTMSGQFWSGTHWNEPWVAARNEEIALTHPDSLTYLKEGYEMINFSFTDIDGHEVSPMNPEYKNKVVLVQVMGSWCPNCVDETRLLNEAYHAYNTDGLEVVALAFEKEKEPAKAKHSLVRFKNALDIEYPIAHAGYAAKDSAAAALPFLNHVMSYPTCIVIDKKGIVRKIRTGFYGPGTGDHYTLYKQEFMEFVEALLEEEV